MARIGEFVYPWGTGHYFRMSRLNEALKCHVPDAEVHFSSKGKIYERLRRDMPGRPVHHVMMPTPIDGAMGPDVLRCMLNVALPVSGNPPLISQIASYLREERRLCDSLHFDMIISDGDMGVNVLAKNRNIPSLFITNQFRPRLWASRFYLYPSLEFVSRQITKATRILVADSPPPYTMCEFNLNLSEEAARKTTYVGHFTRSRAPEPSPPSDLERLIDGPAFGYWMRTGSDSTNDGTGRRYEEVFADPRMSSERRIVSHARQDPSIDSVLGRDGKRYSIPDALDRRVDWLQIDVGFLSEQEKDTVLEGCSYAVVNGSHTVLGEILGGKRRPVIGMPVYDEHSNNLRWVEQKGLGIMARSASQAAAAVRRIRRDAESFREQLDRFAENFVADGAQNAAKIAAETLEGSR